MRFFRLRIILITMSFNRPLAEDLESGDAASAHYKDYPEFESLSQDIDNSLYNINNNQLVSIRNLLLQYEAVLQDSEGDRMARISRISHKISELSTKCTDLFKKLNETTKLLNAYLRECEQNHEDDDAVTYLKQKESLSVNLIKNSLHQFQRLQKKFNVLQKRAVQEAPIPNEQPNQSYQAYSGLESQQVQITYEPVNAEELEQQTLLIEEREREIQQISLDTQEINDIFLNLQDIIHEQQFQVDTIEENILSYSADAQGAARELRKAERYQKRAGGRMFCCLLILIGVVGSIVLIGVVF